ncbi:MAG: DUF4349 domain-containing protein [Chloroflexi bacterium]|nr:DUF4349 domain-containing protein [Chloroflexota bacterium]
MPSRDTTFGRQGPTIFVLLVIASIVAACGGAATGALSGAPAATAGPAPLPGTDQGNGSGSELDGGTRDKVNYLVGQPDLLIIKTGSMVLQVTGIDAALTAATQQITALGGYASGSDRSGDGESDQATITFRIPAAKWEQALTGLHGLATKVLLEQTKTDDVTTQVVDLDARIKNLQATERALQAIMDRAVEIKDVLAVQAELTTVRGQIEQMTAEMTNLQGQAAYSTLSVTFSLKPNPVLTSQQQFDPKSEVDQASASLVSILQGIATAGIWFAIVWLPILLALAIIVGVGLFIYRRVRRSSAVPAAASSGGESGT